jgi:hypothetical protein
MRAGAFRLFVYALASLGFAHSASSQIGVNYFPDRVGVWRRWTMSCDGSGHGLTREQNRTYAAKLQKLSEAVHRARVFNPPMGIEVQPSGCVNASMEFLDEYPDARRTGPIPGYLMVGTFSYFHLNGAAKIMVADEGPHFFVDVNSLVGIYRSLPEAAQDDRGKMFIAPEIARTVSGFPLYKNGVILITRISRPVFEPVSAQRFLQALVGKAQAELGEDQRKHRELVGEKREQSVQQSYQMLKAMNAQTAETFLRSARESDRQADRTFTQLEQAKQAEIANYQTQLASLSPEQRSAQTYVDPNQHDAAGNLRLTEASHPGAQPLVCFNPGFFDHSRPRIDFQTLVVRRIYERSLRENSYDPEYLRVIQFRQTFDFQSLLPLLDQ